jgi:beta-glucanase (GH16 family)
MKQTTFLILFLGLLISYPSYSQVVSGYELVWSEEFNDTTSTVNAANWNFEVGGNGWGNQELEYYTDRPENARVENGNLVIEAKKETYSLNGVTKNYTSARLTTKTKANTLYGKVEARISLPKGQGTWPAFWMMPEVTSFYGAWPRSGEIDIMEHIGSDPKMISYAVHTKDKNGTLGNNWSYKIYPDNIENTFHTYAIEWDTDFINFNFDGVTQVTLWRNLTGTWTSWPFDKNFYVILNLAIGGKMGGAVQDTIFNQPVKMLVDYVRIYKSTSAISLNKADKIMVYPTCFDNYLMVKSDESANVTISDLTGRRSISTDVTGIKSLDTSTLSSGIYLVTVKQKEKTTTYKILKK